MKKYIVRTLFTLLLVATSACSTEEIDNSTSDVALITSVTLGKLTQYVTMTASTGADSVYAATVTGALYPMTIDHYNSRIYNPDSLPATTDLRKVLFENIAATGGVTLKTLAGADTAFSTKDSVDFTQPRQFVVHANDGENKRVYTVELRRHKQYADATTWTKLAPSATLPADALLKRAVIARDKFHLFATQNGNPILLTADQNDARNWTKETIQTEALDLRSVHYVAHKFFALANGALVASESGADWQIVNDKLPVTPLQLLAASSERLLLLTASGLYSSNDAGATWTADQLDAPAQLPLDYAALATIASPTDPHAKTLLLVGMHQNATSAWTQHINLHDTQHYAWVKLTDMTFLPEVLPNIQNFQLLPYDGGAILVGETREGRPATIYSTVDNGMNWSDDKLSLPAFDASTISVASAVAEGNYLYLFLGQSGEVWRGRINRLGWAPIEEAFTN